MSPVLNDTPSVDFLIEEMPSPFLVAVAEKIFNKIRLSKEEGLQLLDAEKPLELEAIRKLADYVRRKKVGEVVHFASCLFFYPTNLCELNCQ